jgi:hypothetical protein
MIDLIAAASGRSHVVCARELPFDDFDARVRQRG